MQVCTSGMRQRSASEVESATCAAMKPAGTAVATAGCQRAAAAAIAIGRSLGCAARRRVELGSGLGHGGAAGWRWSGGWRSWAAVCCPQSTQRARQGATKEMARKQIRQGMIISSVLWVSAMCCLQSGPSAAQPNQRDGLQANQTGHDHLFSAVGMPAERPISFTIPTPFGVHCASTFAARTAPVRNQRDAATLSSPPAMPSLWLQGDEPGGAQLKRWRSPV